MRNQNQEAEDRLNNYVNCSISQWGVGAKTAGFYLGTAIKVVTCAGDDRVYEIELSKSEMNEKEKQSGNAFRTIMHERKRGDLDSCSFKQDALHTHEAIRRVMEQELEPGSHHFSRFLITTDTPTEFQLTSIRGSKEHRDGRDMTWPLADVYYRLLHGPYGEHNGTLNNKAKWMCPTISLEYHSQNVRKWHVRDLRDVLENPQRQYMRKRSGDIFRCEIEFVAEAENDVPTNMRCVARVEVLYYPKLWEGETHPCLAEAARLEDNRLDEKEAAEVARERPRAAAVRAGLVQPLQQQPHEQHLSADDENDKAVLERVRELRSGSSVCSQFWNGRLIPAPQDKLLWFMTEASNTKDNKADLKDALGRLHYSIFCCYPVLTDRVKLRFRGDLIDWINIKADNPGLGRVRDEYSVDSRSGQSKKCTRKAALTMLFRDQLKEWIKLDENYKFDDNDRLEQQSLDEDFPHFTQVQVSSDRWVKQGDVQLINVKGVREPTFIRVLCIRLETNTQEYLERLRREVASQGSVIGYIEPREREESAAATNSFKFNNDRSLQSLLRADPIKRRPAIDLKLAPYRLRKYPLRQVEKQISEDEFNKHYQTAVKKAAESFPTRIAVYVLPWHELKDGEEMQVRVKDYFPGSSVIALTAKTDAEQLPVPVAGEEVRQRTFKVMDERSRQPVVKQEAEANEDGRRGTRSTNPRAGQLASRQRIPRVVREEKEEVQEETNENEVEMRVSSSGRAIRWRLHPEVIEK